MRILRPIIAATVAAAVTWMLPGSPAQAAPAIDVDYSASCGRVTVMSTTDVFVYYGHKADFTATNLNTADGAVTVEAYSFVTFATSSPTIDLAAFGVHESGATAKYFRHIAVPQNCGNVTAPKPTISGKAQVGKTLSAKVGTWVPVPLITVFQWYRNGKPIADANGQNYTLSASDRGKHVTVKMSATFIGYAAVNRTSKPTATVKTGVITAPRPTISRDAWTASAKAGTWTPRSVALSYQWYLGEKKISGATSATFTIPTSYVKKYLRVQVTGKAAGYTTKVQYSKPFLVTASS